jgi:hypothetical protein
VKPAWSTVWPAANLIGQATKKAIAKSFPISLSFDMKHRRISILRSPKIMSPVFCMDAVIENGSRISAPSSVHRRCSSQ